MADGLDGDAASLLPALISAHPVGDDGESPLSPEFGVVLWFPVEIGILIVGALMANVAEARHFNARSSAAGFHRHHWIVCARVHEGCNWVPAIILDQSPLLCANPGCRQSTVNGSHSP